MAQRGVTKDMGSAFLHKKSLLDQFKDDYAMTDPIKARRTERQWDNPIVRRKRERGIQDWAKSFAGRRHYRKLARFNAMRNEAYTEKTAWTYLEELGKLEGEESRMDAAEKILKALGCKPGTEGRWYGKDGEEVDIIDVLDNAEWAFAQKACGQLQESKKSEAANEALSYEKGHKNSRGEDAPWVIRDHKGGKVLASFAKKKDAEDHLERMQHYSKSEKFEYDDSDPDMVMAVRICRANKLDLDELEEYGSDEYWILESLRNLEDLDTLFSDYVKPTKNKKLIADFKANYLSDDGDESLKKALHESRAKKLERMGSTSTNGLAKSQGDTMKINTMKHEALDPKFQRRRKIDKLQQASLAMKGFDEYGCSFLDLYDKGKDAFNAFLMPFESDSKEKALAEAERRFGDYDAYVEYGAAWDEVEEAYMPYLKLKPSIFGLSAEEGIEVLEAISDAIYEMMYRK